MSESSPLPLESGIERAADWDHWLHHALSKDAFRAEKAPRVKIPYLIKMTKEPDAPRPWALEMSGRLLSKAFDVREAAERTAQKLNNPSLRFRGIAFTQVANIRSIQGWDIWAEPTPDDPAHANLVRTSLDLAPRLSDDVPEKQAHEPYRLLSIQLQVCDPDDMTALEQARSAKDASTGDPPPQ